MTIKYAVALVLSLAGSGLITACGQGAGPAAAGGSEPFWEALGFIPDRRDGHTHILR